MPVQLTQLEREPYSALVKMSFEAVEMIGRAGHQPKNKTAFIDAVNLAIIAHDDSESIVDQDDIDTVNALATYQAAFAALIAIANP